MKQMICAVLVVVGAFVVAACGDDDDNKGGSTSGAAGTSGAATNSSDLTGTCATLKECCPKYTDPSTTAGCNIAVANCGNNQKVCTDTLNDYKGKGCDQ